MFDIIQNQGRFCVVLKRIPCVHCTLQSILACRHARRIINIGRMRNHKLDISPTLTFQKSELSDPIHPAMKDLIGTTAAMSLQNEGRCIMLCHTLQYIWMYKPRHFLGKRCFDAEG